MGVWWLRWCLVLVLCTQLSFAVGIGVNKGVINFDEVLQNGYAQEVVTVSTDSDVPIGARYELVGELAPWIRIEPSQETFTFSRNAPYEMTIIIEPPPDAQLRSYEGGVRVLTTEVGRTANGRIGTATRTAFFIRIGSSITGTQRLECLVGGVDIRATEVGLPFEFRGSVINRGNVRVTPEYTITVRDQLQEQVVDEFTLAAEEILPTVTQRTIRQVSHDLAPGQYWAFVETDACEGGRLITFDVLERGGIADYGELQRIEVSSWANTGEIIPIYAVFSNLGERTVAARFQGTITDEDGERIHKVIDTTPVNIPPGETTRIETFFNPTEPGRYIVAGRVHYNNKLTFQRSAIVNVRGNKLIPSFDYTLVIIIGIIIFLLLLLILKKRRRR